MSMSYTPILVSKNRTFGSSCHEKSEIGLGWSIISVLSYSAPQEVGDSFPQALYSVKHDDERQTVAGLFIIILLTLFI